MLGGGVGVIATATVLIVVLQPKGPPAPERMLLPGRGEPTTSCDVLDMTPQAIWAELGSHPVPERNAAAVKYEDKCIAWTLPLMGVFPVVPKDAGGEEGIAEVYLNAGGSTFMLVTIRVKLAEHPELKGVEEKTQIALRGRITRVVMGLITLHDVKFAVPEERGSGPPTPEAGAR
jgi:hypothetical protein